VPALPRPSKKTVNKGKDIDVKDIYVLEVSAKKVEGQGTVQDLKVTWATDINEFSSDFFRIIARCQVSFDPPMFFDLVAKYAIEYTHDGMSRSEVEKKIDELAGPCCGKNTLIMAELSQNLQGYPVIIAPYIERDPKK
jgi:hypothetical protein